MADYVVDRQPATARMPEGFSVWRILFAKEMSRDDVVHRGPGIVAEMFRHSFQPRVATIYWYGQAAAEAVYASGNARPFALIELQKGTAEKAAMGVPNRIMQTRCWPVEGLAHCLEEPAGGEPHWWTLWWVYWRGEPVDGPWPIVRDSLSGRVLAVVDVISVPERIRWDPPDKRPGDVARAEISAAVEQTWQDVEAVATDLGKQRKNPWVWLAGIAVAVWFLRPFVKRLPS